MRAGAIVESATAAKSRHRAAPRRDHEALTALELLSLTIRGRGVADRKPVTGFDAVMASYAASFAGSAAGAGAHARHGSGGLAGSSAHVPPASGDLWGHPQACTGDRAMLAFGVWADQLGRVQGGRRGGSGVQIAPRRVQFPGAGHQVAGGGVPPSLSLVGAAAGRFVRADSTRR